MTPILCSCVSIPSTSLSLWLYLPSSFNHVLGLLFLPCSHVWFKFTNSIQKLLYMIPIKMIKPKLALTNVLTHWLVYIMCKILLTRLQLNKAVQLTNQNIILHIGELGMDWPPLPPWTFPRTWRSQISKHHECLHLSVIPFLPKASLSLQLSSVSAVPPLPVPLSNGPVLALG